MGAVSWTRDYATAAYRPWTPSKVSLTNLLQRNYETALFYSAVHCDVCSQSLNLCSCGKNARRLLACLLAMCFPSWLILTVDHSISPPQSKNSRISFESSRRESITQYRSRGIANNARQYVAHPGMQFNVTMKTSVFSYNNNCQLWAYTMENRAGSACYNDNC